jgi:ABC-type multidrug transport system fused ATPase/permease subunit
VASSALFAVLFRKSLDPSLAGLSISYALSVTQTLNWMVRMTSERETNIVSVERNIEYSHLPSEAPSEIPENRPADDWPSKGEIKIENLCVRYRSGLDLVLKNFNAEIPAGAKIGVVGRYFLLF